MATRRKPSTPPVAPPFALSLETYAKGLGFQRGEILIPNPILPYPLLDSWVEGKLVNDEVMVLEPDMSRYERGATCSTYHYKVVALAMITPENPTGYYHFTIDGHGWIVKPIA